MKRARLDDTTPVEGFEKPAMLMKRMERDGYLVRVRETGPNGEEDVSWILGPRAKVEIGDEGVRGLTKTVYGEPQDADGEELDRRISRSLGVGDRPAELQQQQRQQRQAEGGAEQKRRGRRRKDEEENDDEEEGGNDESDDE